VSLGGKSSGKGEEMKKFSYAVFTFCAIVANASAGQIGITEWMYNGLGAGSSGEFVELTNLGASAIDMTGWSFDDNSRQPGSQSLSAFGIVQPGQSVIFTDITAATFISNWSLVGVSVIGGNTNNLGRADEINIYDNTNLLVDRLTYDDQTISGCPRTQSISGNPITPAALGANACGQWKLSQVGDVYGSYASSLGEIGNPGRNVPEPMALLPLLLGTILIRRRN
jgi:predicted extracellular nuclease